MSSALDGLAAPDDIQALFYALLGRPTTEEHIRSFIEQRTEILNVLKVIIHSDEMCSRFRGGSISSTLNSSANDQDIRTIFQTLLHREVPADQIDSFKRYNSTILDVIKIVLNSNEMIRCLLQTTHIPHLGIIDDYRYRIPNDLSLGITNVNRVLLVGSCMLGMIWQQTLMQSYPEIEFDYITFNNASALPAMAPDIAGRYDFQLLQIPLRSVIPESTYFGLRYSDDAGYEALFADCCTRLSQNLDAILAYHRQYGLPSYIVNFLSIQQNPIGRMQERYSLKNLAYFIEQLNRFLYEETTAHKNVQIIDFDEIAGMFGKKYVNEDLVFVTSHGSVLVDAESHYDGPRLHPIGSTTQLYGAQPDKYIVTAFEEARAMHRTLRQTDSVKLVIFDLDDTLWRGVAAEIDDVGPDSVEGWPIGLVEALSYLWRRGIMLAICSKNDIENVTRIWNDLYGDRFGLDKFVKVEANWRPKVDNVADMLAAVNVLPSNVVFVDDNPVERAAVKAAFPEIRLLDAPVVSWRRILLWSTETQQAVLTDEAIERTDMVQAQIRRDGARTAMSREDFLATLGVEIGVVKVHASDQPKFDRCFELINKTNQFNTTGIRWSLPDAQQLFSRGGYWIALEVKDVYTNYGLTGVIVIDGPTIQQFVLSCRVFGMGVEAAGIAIARRHIRHCEHQHCEGLIVETAKNKLSQAIFNDAGFTVIRPGVWFAEATAGSPVPGHIKLIDPLENPAELIVPNAPLLDPLAAG